MTQFIIKRNMALWQVFYVGGKVAVYSNLSRARCGDWVKANTPKEVS